MSSPFQPFSRAVTSYPVTFVHHDVEQLFEGGVQPPHVFGVSAAALSQAVRQGDVLPHLGHDAGVLGSRAAFSVIYRRGSPPSKHRRGQRGKAFGSRRTAECEKQTAWTSFLSSSSVQSSLISLDLSNFFMLGHTHMDVHVEFRHVCHAIILDLKKTTNKNQLESNNPVRPFFYPNA